jgi:hypothetical protein
MTPCPLREGYVSNSRNLKSCCKYTCSLSAAKPTVYPQSCASLSPLHIPPLFHLHCRWICHVITQSSSTPTLCSWIVVIPISPRCPLAGSPYRQAFAHLLSLPAVVRGTPDSGEVDVLTTYVINTCQGFNFTFLILSGWFHTLIWILNIEFQCFRGIPCLCIVHYLALALAACILYRSGLHFSPTLSLLVRTTSDCHRHCHYTALCSDFITLLISERQNDASCLTNLPMRTQCLNVTLTALCSSNYITFHFKRETNKRPAYRAFPVRTSCLAGTTPRPRAR